MILKARPDGRTRAQVVLDLVGDAPPDTVFVYERIAESLSDGSDTAFDRQSVQQVIRDANKQLLETRQRVLRNVKNVGYRVAQAREHSELATQRVSRSRKQMRWAVRTLQHARTDEMTEQERQLHNAQLIINTELFEQQERMRRDQKRLVDLVANISHRLDQKGI